PETGEAADGNDPAAAVRKQDHERAKSAPVNKKTTALVTEGDRKPAEPADEPDRDRSEPQPLLPREVQTEHPPRVRISRAEPREPRAEGSLTIFLTGSQTGESSLQYQYRLGSQTDWQPAAEGQVKLTKLKPGVLKLEVRVVDSRGRPSPVVTRTWTIKPQPR